MACGKKEKNGDGTWRFAYAWYASVLPESFYAVQSGPETSGVPPLAPKGRMLLLFSGILLATAASFGAGTWYFRYSQDAGLNADTMVTAEDKTGGTEGYTCTILTAMYPRTVTCEDSTCPPHRLPRPSCSRPCAVVVLV